MAKNRKNQSSAVRFVPAMKAIILCTLLGGSGVGYVLQKNKIYELGRQITKREMALERLKWENKVRANQLATLQMPAHLVERVKGLNLGLVMPQPGQIIWLPEPPVEKQTNMAAPMFVLGK
jgi:hypothetical protein